MYLLAQVTFVLCVMQLPPVCFHRQEDDKYCASCHISNSWAWREALKFNLTEPVRTANDPVFTRFLNIIRVRRPTQAELDAIFDWSKCLVSTNEVGYYVMSRNCRNHRHLVVC
jgi:hypothetical protein